MSWAAHGRTAALAPRITAAKPIVEFVEIRVQRRMAGFLRFIRSAPTLLVSWDPESGEAAGSPAASN